MIQLRIAAGDGDIPVTVSGRGEAVLLLHGWTLDRRCWMPQLEGLADRALMIAPDRRGHGENAMAAALGAEPGDIDRLLAHFDLERVVLVGLSQGGRVALRYAASRPGRVRGLVLTGAPLDGFAPPARGGDRIPLDAYGAMVLAGRIDEMRAAWLTHPMMETPATRSDLRALAADMLARWRPEGLFAEDPAPPALAASLEGIRCPVLLAMGAQDTRWLHLVSDALAYGLPDARKVVIPGAGHLVNMTHPAAYNAALAAFLDGLGAR